MIADDDPIFRQLPYLAPDRLKLLIAHSAGLLAHQTSASSAAYVCARISDELREQDDGRSMRAILNEVAMKYELTLEELRGGSRRPRVAHPRQEAAWLMRQVCNGHGHPKYSYPQIGDFLGLHHTTVMHSVGAHARRKAAEAEAA